MLKKLFNKIDKRFKVITRDDNLGIVMVPGDTLELSYDKTYTDLNTGEILHEESEVILKETIKEPLVINSAVIFEFENALGMKRGIGGAFGEKE
jgi:hypothetical protein